MAAADAWTIAQGTPGFDLMRRAGRCVADVARNMLDPVADGGAKRRVIVLCGPGNNGGDGFVAASLLQQMGYDVRVYLLGAQSVLKGDAARAAQAWEGDISPMADVVLDDAGLVIDALFGAGLSKPITGGLCDLIHAVNAAGIAVLAVDLPSGICGASGSVLGCAFKAARTVTFFRKKPGHLLLPGREYCARVIVGDIGIRQSALHTIAVDTHQNTPGLWRDRFPFPSLSAHKYTRGHALVTSGPLTATGAARLAARAALRAGAGAVTLLSPGGALAVNAAQITALMLERIDDADGLRASLQDARRNAILLGPAMGIGAHTRAFVETALDSGASVVLDADAITSYAARTKTLHEAIAQARGAVVLTPHGGEFARLYEDIAADTRLSKIQKARSAARRCGAVVVYKGADTVIAAPDGQVAINTNAPPWLATAGSGDVLAGIILGLLAQSMAAFDAACAGVWLHGEAGTIAGPGLIAEDLDAALSLARKQLYNMLNT